MALVKPRFVDEETVEKKAVEVAPVLVSTLKTELEAAFKMLKARPFAGEVWMVVVP